MQIKISDIRINTGRRSIDQQNVEELSKSIQAVGLMNPITISQDNTLIAGLHRLEAAKLLGWRSIECTISSAEGIQAELAEIDENIVRARPSRHELGEQLLRRKEIYEMLHPETKAGVAQAIGMNRALGNNISAKLAPTEKPSKPFVQDTANKTGMSARSVSRLLQIANNLTADAKKIVEANAFPQDTALKLSRLPQGQQIEAASLLASGSVQSVEQYQQERREKIMAAHALRPDTPPKDTRTAAEKEREKRESLNSLMDEFTNFTQQFIDRMKMYEGFADAFAEMSLPQIGRVWDGAAAVDMAIIAFSKAVKAVQAQNENGGNDNEN